MFSERKCSGAYVLDVYSGKVAAARLLFLDSGATRLSFTGIKYYPATEEQIRYTNAVINQNDCPPTFVFQHVPVREIYELVDVVSGDYNDAVRGHGPYKGKQLRLASSAVGTMGEAPCPSWDESSQFSDWVRSGNVKAAFFGHDHKNSFEGVVSGIRLIHTACAGLSCYGSDALRGGRLVELGMNGRMSTAPLYYRALMKNATE